MFHVVKASLKGCLLLTLAPTTLPQAEAGKMVMAGAFGETPEGALFIFKDSTPEVSRRACTLGAVVSGFGGLSQACNLHALAHGATGDPGVRCGRPLRQGRAGASMVRREGS